MAKARTGQDTRRQSKEERNKMATKQRGKEARKKTNAKAKRIIESGETVMEAGRTVVYPRRVVVGSNVNATTVANGVIVRDRNKLLQSFTMTKLY